MDSRTQFIEVIDALANDLKGFTSFAASVVQILREDARHEDCQVLMQSIEQSIASIYPHWDDMIQLGRSIAAGDKGNESMEDFSLPVTALISTLRNMRSSMLQVRDASQRFELSCPDEFDPKLRDLFWGVDRKAKTLLEDLLNEDALQVILQDFIGRQDAG
jgi:hypothetical protein